jgi:hypothetical protein
MKRTRRRPPYKPNGRTTFNVRGVPGVYVIYNGRSPVYVGQGRDVYRALYRHFQSWDDPKQVRVTYGKRGGYTVRVIYTTRHPQAVRLERALILKYKPQDNPTKLKTYELTDSLAALAESSENAPFMPSNDEAPF